MHEDDVIAQIETDKVTIDVKFAGKSGKITSVAVGEGDTVVVGQKVAEFEEGDFGSASSSSSSTAAAAPEPAEAEAAPPPPPKQQPAAAAPAPPTPPPTPKQQAAPAPKVRLDQWTHMTFVAWEPLLRVLYRPALVTVLPLWLWLGCRLRRLHHQLLRETGLSGEQC